MKPHPLAERIDAIAPKVSKLGHGIRAELESLLADVKSHLEASQAARSRGGIAGRGKSGRPCREPPECAMDTLYLLAGGHVTANFAAGYLRAKFPDAGWKFNPETLRKWAKQLKESE